MKSGISDGDQMTLRAKAKLDKLIEEKKLTPISLEELRLMGDVWPPQEDLDEFITLLHEWRSESRKRTVP